MNRLLTTILQDKYRLLVIAMITFFLGVPNIIFGNSSMIDGDLRSIKSGSHIANNFECSVENNNYEPYILAKGTFESKKEFIFDSEGNTRSSSRHSLEVNQVTFFVFNQDGIPIQNAIVQLSEGSSAMTDEFGFAFFNLFNDAYLAEIFKPLHETVTIEFIVADEDLFLEIELLEMPPGSLQILCPEDVNLPAGDMCFAADFDLGEPIIIDNSPGFVVINDIPLDGFPLGATEVTWTVENEWGETASCIQLVSVFDEEPPTISPIPDININNEPGQCGSPASWDPPAVDDNCEGVSLEESHGPGDFFPVGSTTVIYTATDMHGNSAFSGFTVEVIDVEPPNVSPIPDITLDNEPGQCGSSVSWEPPTVDDNCEGVTVEGSHTPGDFFPVGSTSVMYTATDVHGNPSYSGFIVEVIDVDPPTVSPIPDVNIDNEPGQCGSPASWDPPVVGDNCEGGTVEGSHAPGDFFPVGSTSVMYTATDVHGNASYVGFTVEVIDVEPPIITTPWPDPYVTINNAAGECGANVSWDSPTASDNCEGGTVQGSHAPGDFFPVGSTSVMYTATDVHGNSSYAGFTVEVIDIEPPSLSPIPDITLDNEPGQCGSPASWEPPVADDNCEGVTVEGSHAPGDFFPVGSTSVMYTATDVHGNSSYAGFTVEVIDIEPPTAICQDITVQLNASGAASIAAGDIDDGSSDACGINSLSIDNTEFDCSDVGTNTVTLTVSDNNGNQSTCSSNVIVQESAICLDCAGVVNGTASIDECGICSGGDTGLVPNESCTDCNGVVNGEALPGTLCFIGDDTGVYNDDCECEISDQGTLTGNVDGLIDCGLRNITLELYNELFPELNEEYTTTVDLNGDYSAPAFSTGTYDVLITVEGYLSKLYPNVIIESGTNELDISGIVAGDLNASNGVNISDFSILNNAFGSIDGDVNYNFLADFNCDGAVNIIDISILNISFGLVGDSPPSNN